MNLSYLQSVDQVPAAYGAALIVAAQNVVNGTAMTLKTTPAVGLAVNVPIMPFTAALNGSTPVVAPVVLDFGFAWGNCTSGSKTVTVADSTEFWVGPKETAIIFVLTSSGSLAFYAFTT